MTNFIRKLTSRKFWTAVVSFVTLILTAKGMPDNQVGQIASIIMAGASVVAYVVAEGLVDASEVSENKE